MNKIVNILALLFLSICSLNAQNYTVVLDAGHGGKDPGAIGRKSKEKDITLSLALKVGNYLTKNTDNINVIYTRKTDVFIPLTDRAKIANDTNADLFVSIHVNAVSNKNVQGTETYVMGLHKSDDNLAVAKLENSAIFYEKNYMNSYNGYDPNSPATFIVLNLFQNAYLDMSLTLAEKLQTQFRDHARRKDLGVKQAGFLVLWQTTMPSVLIEVGFISNGAEEIYLNSNYGQEIIASAIYRAIRDYFNDL
ncbi:MAG: N-acetylmuramoyl-L-alanine amidase [Bacteroidales bacterium]|nr:N-acetylmuramoyl-L-alanine amidase [Bacteroidales bacterium]